MFRFFSEFWFGIENMFPHKQTRHKKIIVRSRFEIENTENQQQAVGIYISRVMVLGTFWAAAMEHVESEREAGENSSKCTFQDRSLSSLCFPSSFKV